MQYNSPLLRSLQVNARLQHLSRRTEQAYIYWTRRFIRFCGLRHPAELGAGEVRQFLSHLVVERKLSAATQQQALSALLFLYRNVIGRSLEELGPLPRGRVPTTLPVVLTRAEVERVLGQLRGIHRLVGMLLYGSGLRVTECLQLRIKDVDLERRELLVRRGKGGKDRVTVLPERLSRPIAAISWASRHCTSVTWPRVAGGWRFLGVWMPSIRRRAGHGPGSGCSRRAVRIGIPKAGG